MSTNDTTTTSPKPAQENDIWLHAWDDALAQCTANSRCMSLTPVINVNYHNFLVAERASTTLESSSQLNRLRVWKGTSTCNEIPLLEEPVAVASFYQDYKHPRRPTIAVAAGPNVFLIRNLQPYYQFKLPEMEIDAAELEIWDDLRTMKKDSLQAMNDLKNLHDKGIRLTKRSMEFLTLDGSTPEQKEELDLFVQERNHLPLKEQSVITCMKVLNKDKDEEDAVGCIVIGTEDAKIMILDPSGSRILKTIQLPATPHALTVSGKHDVDYRIIAACRNGNVYTIKNGELSGVVIELESQPTDIVRIDKTILIGTMNNTIHCYHTRGKKQYSIYLPSPIKAMEVLEMKGFRNVKCLIVALENRELRVYSGKTLTNTTITPDRVIGLCFGTYGTEVNALVIAYANGGLAFKFVSRQAKLEVPSQTGPPPEQNIPLKLPKRTKLYIEQTKREKEYAVEMHRIFQRDLCKLRLTTAKAFVKILTDGQGPLSYTSGSSLRLSAQVQGLGPSYKIRLSLQNSGQNALHNIPILFQYNQSIYTIEKPLIIIPVLVPTIQYKYTVDIRNVDQESEEAESVHIFVCNNQSSAPILTAVVQMPVAMQL